MTTKLDTLLAQHTEQRRKENERRRAEQAEQERRDLDDLRELAIGLLGVDIVGALEQLRPLKLVDKRTGTLAFMYRDLEWKLQLKDSLTLYHVDGRTERISNGDWQYDIDYYFLSALNMLLHPVYSEGERS